LWVTFALLDPDPDPDPATQINEDPCGSEILLAHTERRKNKFREKRGSHYGCDSWWAVVVELSPSIAKKGDLLYLFFSTYCQVVTL
jgi:hypothetical protein